MQLALALKNLAAILLFDQVRGFVISRIASDFMAFDLSRHLLFKCLFNLAFCSVPRMVPLDVLANSKFLRHDNF